MLILLLITIIKTDKRLLGFVAFFFFLPVLGLSREHLKAPPALSPVVAETAGIIADPPHNYIFPRCTSDHHPHNKTP